MLLQDQHPLNRHLTASVLGVPNVGKSSLINAFLGTNLSVVTRFPQTTRNKFHCVFTVDHTEIVLVDTPGVHRSNREFNKRMNQQAREGIRGVDLNLVLIDLTFSVAGQIENILSGLRVTEPLGKIWVVFSKADKLVAAEDGSSIENLAQSARLLLEQSLPGVEKVFFVSAERGDNMHLLVGALMDEAQEGPHLYPDGEISNKSVRFFACEYIREQIFLLLREEVPYQTAVVIEEYRDIKEKEGGVSCHISASILVNTPGQRAIVIGRQGSLIKEIGTLGRKKIEAMVGGKVFLNLHVKVVSKWFKHNRILEEIGLPRATDSNRVWHSQRKKR